MTDVTVTTDNPQSQPGSTRTPDGTITDQSPNTTPTEPISTDGDSFLTKKESVLPEAPPAETKTEPPKTETPQAAPEKYGDFKLPDGYQFDKDSLEQATTLFKESG